MGCYQVTTRYSTPVLYSTVTSRNSQVWNKQSLSLST